MDKKSSIDCTEEKGCNLGLAGSPKVNPYKNSGYGFGAAFRKAWDRGYDRGFTEFTESEKE